MCVMKTKMLISCTADLRLCFRICKLLEIVGFLMRRLTSSIFTDICCKSTELLQKDIFIY